MKKKLFLLALMLPGFGTTLYAADQIYFEATAGVYFYPGFGGKLGWMHYWNNEKRGLIIDVSYFNNGFVDEIEGDWREVVKIAHNFGLAAGIVFNNMGMDGVFRTSEYIKLKLVYDVWGRPKFIPYINAGVKGNFFFTERAAVGAGLGIELAGFQLPYPYISLGMTFTL